MLAVQTSSSQDQARAIVNKLHEQIGVTEEAQDYLSKGQPCQDIKHCSWGH